MHRPDASPSFGGKRRKRRMVPPPTLRVFHCLCCDNQVMLCSGCYRGQRYCSKACRALLRPAQVRGTGRIYQSRPAGRALHAARQRAYWARRSAAKVASLYNSPALATSSQSALIPPSPRAQRPGQSIPDTKRLRMQTCAARRWREDAEMDHIRSLRLKPWSVTGLVPLCSNCGRRSNGFLLVGPRMTKRERLRRSKERRQRLRQH
jgi:hypothetical protein